MKRTGFNEQHLPGVSIPEKIKITDSTHQAMACETLLIAVPMQALRSVLKEHEPYLTNQNLVACCKGMELTTHLGPVGVIADILPQANPALLTGPSFAQDIASRLPTALTLACANSDKALELQQTLACDTLRIYRTTDTVGAELGGALKNVIAIACGTAIGAGLGDSARAAIMTRGFTEMVRLAAILGASRHTLSGLSGLGDLALTCTSKQSRNYRMGLSLGSGNTDIPEATIEGIASARAIATLAQTKKIDLPITTTVADLVDGKVAVKSAIRSLLSRPLNKE